MLPYEDMVQECDCGHRFKIDVSNAARKRSKGGKKRLSLGAKIAYTLVSLFGFGLLLIALVFAHCASKY